MRIITPLVVVAIVAFGWVRLTDDGGDNASPARARAPLSLPETVASLEQKTSDRPGDIGAWQQLGAAYAALAHQIADPTLYGKANEAFDRADEIQPDAPATLVARARVNAVLHRFAEAHAFAVRALDAKPLDADALVMKVDAEIELGRYEDAAQSLQTLLDHRPGMAALARASYLRELHGDVDGALLALRQAEAAGTQAPPSDRALTMRIRADVLFNHGRVADAEIVYRSILDLEPGYADARIGLARVAASRGDFAGGIAALQQLLTEVDDPHAWIALADIQRVADDGGYAHSVEKVRELLSAEQANGAAIDLELALFDADHGGDATATVQRAEQAHRDRPSVHGADVLAWALHRAGRSGEAVPYVDEALRLGSIDASLRYHAAAIFAATGDGARARQELTTAFELNPSFSFALRGEATALASQLGVTIPAGWS